MNQEHSQSLAQGIKDFLDDRPTNCDYYQSWEYRDNRDRHSVLIDKIFKRIGKKLRKRIFRDYLDMEQLEGELHAGLQESCYRLGFQDALQLANQLDEVGKGHLSIFN